MENYHQPPQKDLDSTRVNHAMIRIAICITPHIHNLNLQQYITGEVPLQEAVTFDHKDPDFGLIEPNYKPEYN
jgi:hypothetical protein